MDTYKHNRSPHARDRLKLEVTFLRWRQIAPGSLAAWQFALLLCRILPGISAQLEPRVVGEQVR